MKYNTKVFYIISLIFSSLYLTYFGLSPVYILLPLLFFLRLIGGCFKFSIWSFILLLCMVGVTIPSIFNLSEASFPILTNYYLSILMFFILSDSFKLSKEELIEVLDKYLVFIIIFCGSDTLLRYLYPIKNELYLVADSKDWFYQYKGSYIFKDSNSVAILLSSALFGNIISKLNCNYNFFKDVKIFIVLFLIVMTISRSVIISVLVGLILIYILENKRAKLVFIWATPFILSLGLYFLGDFIYLVGSDGSGSHKIRELSAIVNFSIDYPFRDIVIGLGFGNGSLLTNTYLHSLFAKSYIEGGLIFFIFLIFLIVSLMTSSRKALYFLIPVVISSFSLSFYIVAPFQAAILAVILSGKEYGK